LAISAVGITTSLIVVCQTTVSNLEQTPINEIGHFTHTSPLRPNLPDPTLPAISIGRPRRREMADGEVHGSLLKAHARP
jgi:hypothetical protein